jgi:hypothetical protein
MAWNLGGRQALAEGPHNPEQPYTARQHPKIAQCRQPSTMGGNRQAPGSYRLHISSNPFLKDYLLNPLTK